MDERLLHFNKQATRWLCLVGLPPHAEGTLREESPGRPVQTAKTRGPGGPVTRELPPRASCLRPLSAQNFGGRGKKKPEP